jgi:hypothetical protein
MHSSSSQRRLDLDHLLGEARRFLDLVERQVEAEDLPPFDQIPIHVQISFCLFGLEQALIVRDWKQAGAAYLLVGRARDRLRDLEEQRSRAAESAD